jgi:1-acyl-sn-glycerol-3-phosphate acyltransferase
MVDPYQIPAGLQLTLAFSWLKLARRSFRADAIRCISGLSPAVELSGLQNIPTSGPYLITFNHFYRPGFNVWWLTMAIASVLPDEPHIIMTGELTYPGRWYAPAGMLLSRFVLKRLARVYGFTSMPPMPPREKDMAARAVSVRSVLSHVDRNPTAVVILAPEGGDQPGGQLAWPPPGVGRFIFLMAAKGLSILPVAGWEQDGELYLNFGQVYDLETSVAHSSTEKDRAASGTVMRAISELLPEYLRGDFA